MATGEVCVVQGGLYEVGDVVLLYAEWREPIEEEKLVRKEKEEEKLQEPWS